MSIFVDLLNTENHILTMYLDKKIEYLIKGK